MKQDNDSPPEEKTTTCTHCRGYGCKECDWFGEIPVPDREDVMADDRDELSDEEINNSIDDLP